MSRYSKSKSKPRLATVKSKLSMSSYSKSKSKQRSAAVKSSLSMSSYQNPKESKGQQKLKVVKKNNQISSIRTSKNKNIRVNVLGLFKSRHDVSKVKNTDPTKIEIFSGQYFDTKNDRTFLSREPRAFKLQGVIGRKWYFLGADDWTCPFGIDNLEQAGDRTCPVVAEGRT